MGFSNTWKSLKRPHIMILIDFAALPTKNSPSFCWDPQVKRLRKHEETVISNHQIRGGQISLQLYWNMSSHMWKKGIFMPFSRFFPSDQPSAAPPWPTSPSATRPARMSSWNYERWPSGPGSLMGIFIGILQGLHMNIRGHDSICL